MVTWQHLSVFLHSEVKSRNELWVVAKVENVKKQAALNVYVL